MDCAFFNLATAKEAANVSINLEDMPAIEKNITEETKKEIAYEILKRMKAKKLLLVTMLLGALYVVSCGTKHAVTDYTQKLNTCAAVGHMYLFTSPW